MPQYCFRIKMRRSGAVLAVESKSYEWRGHPGEPILKLTALGDDKTLRNAEELVFSSDGWPSEAAASDAGTRYLSALLRTFARLRLGVDYGQRRPDPGGFTREILASMGETHGFLMLNERHGIMVYPTDLPVVLSGSTTDCAISLVQYRFDRVLAAAMKRIEPLSDKELIALDLFNASFFQKMADTRLLLLVMAIEALLKQEPRPAPALAHVERMIELTDSETTLSCPQRASIMGGLRWLKVESIRQSGLGFIARELGDRRYMDLSAAKFFDHCYGIRSALAHGECPLPQHMAVSKAAANLEVMVSDLLAGSLRDVDLIGASPVYNGIELTAHTLK